MMMSCATRSPIAMGGGIDRQAIRRARPRPVRATTESRTRTPRPLSQRTSPRRRPAARQPQGPGRAAGTAEGGPEMNLARKLNGVLVGEDLDEVIVVLFCGLRIAVHEFCEGDPKAQKKMQDKFRKWDNEITRLLKESNNAA